MTLPVAFTVNEPVGIAREAEPVTIGVPFARGRLRDPGALVLEDGSGRPIPCQALPLNRWSDGSIRWLLLSFLADVDAHGTLTGVVRLPETFSPVSSPLVSGAPPLQVEETRTHFLVDTGMARFELPRGVFGPFSRVLVGGVDLLGPVGSATRLEDLGGSRVPFVDTSSIEVRGPLRTVLRFEGVYRRDSGRGDGPSFLVRLEFFAGSPRVRMEVDLHNPAAACHAGGLWDLGDPGSYRFVDLSVTLSVAPPAERVVWKEALGGPCKEVRSGAWKLYQDSSGGNNWRSPNHVDAVGAPTVSFQGYRVTFEELDRGRRAKDGCAGEAARRETFGLRARPSVQVFSDRGWVAATVVRFWENFPKCLEATGGRLRVGLFPAECRAGFELQGGEKKRHVVGLSFGTEPQVSTGLEAFLAPLQAALAPAWVDTSGAVPWFIPAEDDPEERYKGYVQGAIEGASSFASKREQVDEFGWRNYGDVYADHEAVHSRSAFPMVAHYNNQYDLIFGAGLHFLRTADQRWATLMTELATHVIDIDIYHTDRDRSAYNHGLFWHTDHYLPAGTATHRTFTRLNRPQQRGARYGGGPSNEHNYTSGLLLYHFLTGDPQGRQAVLELAEWVIAMDDGTRTVLAPVDSGPTGWASQTGSPDYHRAGRGAGNSINALLDGFLVSGERRFLDKAERLIERCVHPAERLEDLHLDEPEYRWSYLVFLQVLGKYLEVKWELGEQDRFFRYAVASLLHFADWMLVHEVPYQDVLHKVLIPTESWPATDVRKAHVLNLAACYASPQKRRAFRIRAAELFRRGLQDLLSYPTCNLTRPMTILVANGAYQGYFARRGEDSWRGESWAQGAWAGRPDPFVPQKRRAWGTLRGRIGTTARELVRMIRERACLGLRFLRP